MGKKTAKYLSSKLSITIRKQWFESCTKLLEVVFNLKCKRPVYCYQFLEPTLACTRQHKNYFKLYLEGHVGKGYRHSQETDGVLWYSESNKLASSGKWKIVSELKLEKKNKIAFDTKVWRSIACSLCTAALHYLVLLCVIREY